MDKPKENTTHHEGDTAAQSKAEQQPAGVAAEAAALREKDMSVLEAIRAYPKAIAYSMILSLCLVMEGYDTALTDAFFSLPQFRERFGEQLDDGDYQITAPWMSGLKNGVQVGQILGLAATGIIAERYGYKKTIVGSLLMLIGFIFIFFFASHIAMLFAAGVLCGLPWGAFQTLTTTYAADVTPIPLRSILTTYVNMCWVMGQLISSGVLRGLISRQDDWAWRIPYAIQWVFPPPIILGVLLAPESPTWLVRKGRIEDARKALRRLASGPTDEEINNTVAMIAYTDHMEKEVVEGVSYLDCFRGTNLRRTEIACMVWAAQVLCGVWFGGNVIYFLQQAGFDPARSFDFGIGTGALALAGTIAAWFVLPHIGRRRLYLVGLSVMLLILLTVGFMGIPARVEAIGWASGALMMVFVVTYDITVGPVCYCLVAEIPTTRLRIKTAVLARNAYNVVSILANLLNPPILNPGAWNLRGKGGFVWAAPCTIALVWTYFRLPETKGRAISELDTLFERRVSARNFAKEEVAVFERGLEHKLDDEEPTV
ncbi:general substrate transporter [Ilyonectria sp. MPI-CAGE-AT-0026]|nr:general substrate transporter [Ilyonectria sp. MPI-CAGE-AT-0026]